MLNYVDPHHKRITFNAATFRLKADSPGREVIFTGRNPSDTVTLVERGPRIAARVTGEEGDFVLWKVQLMKNSNWLTLDFDQNPLLSRIVVQIEHLDANELDAALKEMFGDRSLLYYRHH